ncbi:MAG TPA: hypothetical protein VFX38_00430 [Gammaproteobacteria bacterium]|nr:hypothetical protein [Gammaproteobacteria bacterium]
MAAKSAIVEALLERHGRSFAEELGIPIAKNTPSPLFRLLCFALLAGARISGAIAVSAARALADEGWTTAERLAGATWRERTDVLNHAGYARYDESTSRMLGETAELLVEEYGGDLRRLRERAGCDPAEERKLLKDCKGIGDVSANIFFREAQAVWGEWYPFADKLALRAAGKLGLGSDAGTLARRVSRGDYPRLVAALVRCELAGDHQEVKAAA